MTQANPQPHEGLQIVLAVRGVVFAVRSNLLTSVQPNVLGLWVGFDVALHYDTVTQRGLHQLLRNADQRWNCNRVRRKGSYFSRRTIARAESLSYREYSHITSR